MERLTISRSETHPGNASASEMISKLNVRKRKLNNWKIDRQIPIAVIAATLFQTEGVIWWAATVEKRLSDAEKQILVYAENSNRLVRIEERIGFLNEQIKSIDEKLENKRYR